MTNLYPEIRRKVLFSVLPLTVSSFFHMQDYNRSVYTSLVSLRSKKEKRCEMSSIVFEGVCIFFLTYLCCQNNILETDADIRNDHKQGWKFTTLYDFSDMFIAEVETED